MTYRRCGERGAVPPGSRPPGPPRRRGPRWGSVAGWGGARADGKPGDGLLRLADGAGGNPLYLTELVAALTRSSGLALTDAGTAELTNGSAPSSLSAAIADRLDFVPGSVRE